VTESAPHPAEATASPSWVRRQQKSCQALRNPSLTSADSVTAGSNDEEGRIVSLRC